jgi:glutathione S-transferase
MLTLFHHPFCPHSRFIRLAAAEHGVDIRLVEERPWARREEFLLMNPAGTTPVMVTDGSPAIAGASVICEFLDETLGPEMEDGRLLAQDRRIPIQSVRHAPTSAIICSTSAGWSAHETSSPDRV